jgi:two-component system chemotaxis sensor kinase CheA
LDEQLEILSDFLVESFETLDKLDQELVSLEQQPNNKEILNSIFRGVHTIKGTCGFLEFAKLESVAHVGENLLDSLRAGRVELNQEIATNLLHLVDAIRSILHAIEATGKEGDVSYDELKSQLKALNEGKKTTSSADDSDVDPLEEAFLAALREHQQVQAQVEARKTKQVPTNVIELTEIIESTPTQQSTPVSDEFSRQAATAPLSEDGLKSQLAETSLRIDVHILDSLMNLVGELVLARNQILRLTKNLSDTHYVSASHRLNRITSELQQNIMKTRMQPIATVWNKFPRVVRDVAKSVNKQVRLEMEGKETDLDKTIIEAIKDPLTHIIRNSVDHGIESPERRTAAGKNPEGVVLLRAFHEGGHVIIEIRDDGAGLNTDRIKQKAVEKNLVSSEKLARMSEQEIHRLIFAPGFSTAEQITNISGRGVGMDVVRSNIEKIGGQVDIYSTRSQGSTIKIKIPLTLAIVPALIISSGGERFAIPQVNLIELVRVNGKNIFTQIEEIRGANFFRLRGNLLPLVYLNRELNLREKDPVEDIDDAALNIIVIKADERLFGLVVDEVHDTEEIVVKPLSNQIKAITVLSGATIMGDGHVALILDVLGLARRGRVLGNIRDDAATQVKEKDKQQVNNQKETLLIIQAAEGYRAAIPLSIVNRLEEIGSQSIEIASGQTVVQYRDGILPLIDLAAYFNAPRTECSDTCHVIVYEKQGTRCGFVVQKIIDIVEEHVAVQQHRKKPGIRGSAIVQKKVTDFLDLEGIIEDAQQQKPITSAIAHLDQ